MGIRPELQIELLAFEQWTEAANEARDEGRRFCWLPVMRIVRVS